MGTVWRAERADGRFEGQAAVKLLNLSLMGDASPRKPRSASAAKAVCSHG